MKISLKLANGAMLEFEGEESEFTRISEFLANPPDSLTTAPSPERHHAKLPNGADDEAPPPVTRLEAVDVAERLEQVGARNDQERVTVMASMAVEGGKDGVDYETVNRLYADLGFRTPSQFPAKTFANAKSSGLVTKVKPGLWKPTYKGNNFARGHGRGERQPSRRPSRSKGSTPKAGGETD